MKAPKWARLVTADSLASLARLASQLVEGLARRFATVIVDFECVIVAGNIFSKASSGSWCSYETATLRFA